MPTPKLVLLDGHALIHRAFHAIAPLSTSAGEPVNAVFGFASMLFNVLEIEKPEYLAVAFDRKGPTFRHHADENYKATRAPTDPLLIAQIQRIYQLVRALQIPIFAESGFEADDVLATLARLVAAANLHTIIVSGDRDLLQLVSAKVSVHDLSGGYRKSVNWTPAVVREKYGFGPELIPDYKALSGDASDNLPGVAGIGPKTATELLQQFGSLGGIYEHLGELRPAVREKLEKNADSAWHCHRMATLRTDAPVEFHLADCAAHAVDHAAVTQLFAELEFRTLVGRFNRLFPATTDTPKNAAASGQLSLF